MSSRSIATITAIVVGGSALWTGPDGAFAPPDPGMTAHRFAATS